MCCGAAGLVGTAREPKSKYCISYCRVLRARPHCTWPGDEASCRTAAEGVRKGYGGSGESEDDGRIDDDYISHRS
jgi:hypothetical protein